MKHVLLFLFLLTACSGPESSTPRSDLDMREEMGEAVLDMTSMSKPDASAEPTEMGSEDLSSSVDTGGEPDAQSMEEEMGDSGSSQLNCKTLGASTPYDICPSGNPDRCALVFSDGAGCEAACQALGLNCVEGYENVEGVCQGDRTLPALGCQDTGHTSDYCECAQTAPQPECKTPATTLFLVGDSTVATNSGWGDFLEDRLSAMAMVENYGVGGRSSKSFWDEGRFRAVADKLGSGDYLLIQFGHNDAKANPERRTEPGEPPNYEGTYRDYLSRYIKAARDAGASPILVTSVSRMVFSNDTPRRTHGNYPDAMRKLAADEKVALLDLEERSFTTFTTLGEAETLRLYAEPGGKDRTHFPPDKAPRVAQMVAELIAASPSPLSCYTSGSKSASYRLLME